MKLFREVLKANSTFLDEFCLIMIGFDRGQQLELDMVVAEFPYKRPTVPNKLLRGRDKLCFFYCFREYNYYNIIITIS